MELPATLEIPFRLRDYDGLVTVSYGEERDPAFWGFDTPGLLFQSLDLELAKGFPVCEARIAYEGPGYHALMGWIQFITHRDPAIGVEVEATVDLFPMLSDADSPFVVFGYAPTFFDAPANPDHGTLDWIADTFLAVCPDVVRTQTVAALLGFRWGYALRKAQATPLPLQALNLDAWELQRPLLHTHYPHWRFLPGFATNLASKL
jgi:hypothetical protein